MKSTMLEMALSWLNDTAIRQSIFSSFIANAAIFFCGTIVGRPTINFIRSSVFFFLVKIKYLSENVDPYHGQYGKYHLYRNSNDGVIDIDFRIYRSIFSMTPTVHWENKNLHPKKRLKGKLKKNGAYFDVEFEGFEKHKMRIIFRGLGDRAFLSIKIGIQTGVTASSQSIYSSRIVISSIKIEESDLQKYLNRNTRIELPFGLTKKYAREIANLQAG